MIRGQRAGGERKHDKSERLVGILPQQPPSPPPVPRRAGQGQSPVAEANVILGKVHFSGSMPRTRDHRALGPILPVPTSLPPSFTRGLGGRAVRPAPFPTLLGPLARVQTAVMSPIVAPQPWLESLLSYRDVPQQVGAAFCASPPRALSPKAPVSALMHVCFLSFPSVPPRGELHDLTITADLPLISFNAVRFRFLY